MSFLVHRLSALGRQVFVEQCSHIFGFVITFITERRIRQFSAVAEVLQRPFRDMESAADFGIAYSAAFGGGIEMAVEPSYRVGQSAGVGLQISPNTTHFILDKLGFECKR